MHDPSAGPLTPSCPPWTRDSFHARPTLMVAGLCVEAPGHENCARWRPMRQGFSNATQFYGWFERTRRGVYCLTGVGEAALLRWPEMTATSVPLAE